MTTLIERNTTVPCSKSQVFTTAENNQPAVDIKVLQGEREFAKDNKTLGTFKLEGIPPASRGVPQIEVAFDINADGLVSVRAKDKATGREQNITITGSGAMSPEEVDLLVEEAKKNEELDKKKRQEIEEKNQLESLIFQSEKLISENKDKIPDGPKELLETSISSAQNILETGSSSQITEEITKLGEVMQEVGKAMYESQMGETQQEPPPTPPADDNDDDIVDAEFEEVS